MADRGGARPCDVAALSSYMDGAPGAEATAVRDHLAACEGCRGALAGLERLSRLLRALPRRALPAGFHARLAGRRAPPALRRAPLAFGTVFAAAAALLLLRGPEQPGFDSSRLKTPEPPAVPEAGLAGAAGVPFGETPPAGPARDAIPRAIQEEASKMGIEAVVAPGERESGGGFLGPRLDGDPLNRAYAEHALRELSAIRRSVAQAPAEPIALQGRTSRLLEAPPPEGGGRLESGAWSGAFGGTNDAGGRTVSDARAWRALWASLSTQPAPEVDLRAHDVVAIFLGPRPTGGFSVEIRGHAVVGSERVVRWRETAPAPGTRAPEGETAPFAMRLVPKSSLPTRFVKE